MSATRPTANDRGHQGPVDLTQIEQMLRLTPTERLRKHESWRLFARRALTMRAGGREKDLAVLPLLEATLEATRRP